LIEVRGLASGTSRFLQYSTIDLDRNLLYWLRANGITIASSCDGEGVCKKCVIQSDWMTCMMTVKDFIERERRAVVEVNYL
jgi:Na+-transporting NADH:ubiquinone oxidoreductase subunit NqrF